MENRINRIEEYLNAFLNVKFENYIELHEFVEDHIEIVRKENDKKWEALEELDDIDIDKVLEEQILQDGFKFDHEFPNRIRYSNIIQTYSMLELYMKWLCERLQKLKGSKFGIHDLKGNSYIEKGKIFLSKLYNIDFRKLEPEWSFINDLRIVRNQIVHKNGEFQLKDKDILKVINQNPDLGIMFEDIYTKLEEDTDYEIMIKSKNLNHKFIENVKSFFIKIFVEIKAVEIDTILNTSL